MKRTLAILIFVFSMMCPSLSEGLADTVVGYWISSTGTPIKIGFNAPNGQDVLMWIGEGEAQMGWLNGSRNGDTILTYKSGDGTTMIGTLDAAADVIRVESESSSFTATWYRKH